MHEATTAEKMQALLTEFGIVSSLKTCEDVVDIIRTSFGVIFSAHDAEWNEDRFLAEMRKHLESGWRPGVRGSKKGRDGAAGGLGQ